MIEAIIQNHFLQNHFLLLFVGISTLISVGQVNGSGQATKPTKTLPEDGTEESTSPAETGWPALPTEPQTREARAKGLVWVNPTTKVYHKDGAFYAKTKSGQFMTEEEAKAKYYRPSPEVQKAAAAQKASEIQSAEVVSKPHTSSRLALGRKASTWPR